MSKICVVIPCYNEAKRLNVKAFVNFIAKNNESFHFLFVNDGSSDDTLIVLKSLESEYPNFFRILNLEQNCGKAEAVRRGVNDAIKLNNYNYIAYFDADLATPLTELLLLKSIIGADSKLMMVLCSRVKRLGARVDRKLARHIFGRVFSTFASQILKLGVYDTQCGAKIIKAEIVPAIFGEPFITSWLFDVEIIARIRNLNPTTINSILYEHPVTEWEDVGGSKLKLKHIIKVPFELLKIKRKYNK